MDFIHTIKRAVNNADFPAFTLKNLDDPLTTEVGQSVSINAYLRKSVDGGSNYTDEQAGQIVFGKDADFFHTTTEADCDGNIQFKVAVDGTLTEIMRIASAGIGIGTATPAGELEMAKAAADQTFIMSCYSDTLGNRNYFLVRKSGSDTLGTLAHTHNDSCLFEMLFQGVKSDDSAFTTAAKMIVQAVGDAGTDYVGAKILFCTGTNAAATATRLGIGNTGQITMGDPDTADAVPLLRVWGGTAGAVNSPADTLVTFEDSGDITVQILGPATAIQMLNFGDVNNVSIGHIAYSHGTDLMYFGAGGTEIMTLSATVLNIDGIVDCDALRIDTAFVPSIPTAEGYFTITILVCGTPTVVRVPCEVP